MWTTISILLKPIAIDTFYDFTLPLPNNPLSVSLEAQEMSRQTRKNGSLATTFFFLENTEEDAEKREIVILFLSSRLYHGHQNSGLELNEHEANPS